MVLSELVSDLFSCNGCESLSGNAARNPLCLRIALAHDGSVGIIALLESSLDQLLDTENRRRFEAVELCMNVLAYCGVEGFGRLGREDLAVVESESVSL